MRIYADADADADPQHWLNISPDIEVYFRVYIIKSVISLGPLKAFNS